MTAVVPALNTAAAGCFLIVSIWVAAVVYKTVLDVNVVLPIVGSALWLAAGITDLATRPYAAEETNDETT